VEREKRRYERKIQSARHLAHVLKKTLGGILADLLMHFIN